MKTTIPGWPNCATRTRLLALAKTRTHSLEQGFWPWQKHAHTRSTEASGLGKKKHAHTRWPKCATLTRSLASSQSRTHSMMMMMSPVRDKMNGTAFLRGGWGWFCSAECWQRSPPAILGMGGEAVGPATANHREKPKNKSNLRFTKPMKNHRKQQKTQRFQQL